MPYNVRDMKSDIPGMRCSTELQMNAKGFCRLFVSYLSETHTVITLNLRFKMPFKM